MRISHRNINSFIYLMPIVLSRQYKNAIRTFNFVTPAMIENQNPFFT